VLYDVLDVFCSVYLNDILIYSDSEEEHEAYVKAVMDRLMKAGL